MSQPVDRAGTFRGQIIEAALYEPESGALGINIKAQIHELWDAETKSWDDWREYDVVAEGTIWIISGKEKGNKPLDKNFESLVQCTGWSGVLDDIVRNAWEATPCQLVIKEDTYKDETTYKISFVNAHDRVPGGSGNVSPDRAKQLQNQYGAQFRALAGNAQRSAPPKGKPKPPTAKQAKMQALGKDIEEANAKFDEAMAEQGVGDGEF